MSCIQVTPCLVRPSTSVSRSSRLPSKPCLVPFRYKKPVWASLRLTANASKESKCSTVVKKYRAPGSQWKPMEKAAEKKSIEEILREQIEKKEKKSIEEILREQIEKKKYAAEPSVSGGGKPPRGGGGGRDRGRGWGDGDSEGKDMSEALQMALATIGSVLLDLLTIHGGDVILLARDYVRFLSTGNRTVRLRKVMEWFSRRRPGSQKRMAVHGIDEDEDNDEDEYAFRGGKGQAEILGTLCIHCWM